MLNMSVYQYHCYQMKNHTHFFKETSLKSKVPNQLAMLPTQN